MPVSMARVFRRGVSPVFKGGGIPSLQAGISLVSKVVSPVSDGVSDSDCLASRGYPRFLEAYLGVSPISKGDLSLLDR